MTKNDEAARKAKAERLRQQISHLTNRGANFDQGSNEEADPSQEVDLPHSSQERPSSSTSPREFIQKRMQELDKEEN
jgi:hypothetical protein